MSLGRLARVLVAALAAPVMLATCDSGRAAGPPEVAAVTIDAPSPQLVVGDSALTCARVADAGGRPLPDRNVTWSSSDARIVRIAARSGDAEHCAWVYARAEGEAVIVATAEGHTDTAAVQVAPVPVAGVAIEPASATIIVGRTQQLAASVRDAEGAELTARTVIWSSSNHAVATVDTGGLVVAVAPGAATVTATSEGKTATAALTVVPVPVASVVVSPAVVSLDVGHTQQLSAVARDSAGGTLAGRPVSWRSSDDAIVAVSTTGLATAVAPGQATVTATIESVGASAALTVLAPPPPTDDTVRVVTFGDSNTDFGFAGRDPVARAAAYVSLASVRLAADAPNSPLQLAGKIEAQWRALVGTSGPPVVAVNHGVGGTTTGGGGHGGANRTAWGSPQARTPVDGVTRFEGEVLGRAWPWSGGEPVNADYPDGPIARVRAHAPTPRTFVYVSMGTNDVNAMSGAQTLANLEWMVDQWVAAGQPARRFIITTLAPAHTPAHAEQLPALNDGIRALAARTGAHLVDLTAHTSSDNGRTWSSSEFHVGDRLHYAEAVRDWLAAQVVAHVRATIPSSVMATQLSR